MQIFVRTLTGKKVPLEVEELDTINAVKTKIQGTEGTLLDQLRLLFAGQQLRGAFSLADYNIHAGSTVALGQPRPRQPPGPWTYDGVLEQLAWAEPELTGAQAGGLVEVLVRLGTYSFGAAGSSSWVALAHCETPGHVFDAVRVVLEYAGGTAGQSEPGLVVRQSAQGAGGRGRGCPWTVPEVEKAALACSELRGGAGGTGRSAAAGSGTSPSDKHVPGGWRLSDFFRKGRAGASTSPPDVRRPDQSEMVPLLAKPPSKVD